MLKNLAKIWEKTESQGDEPRICPGMCPDFEKGLWSLRVRRILLRGSWKHRHRVRWNSGPGGVLRTHLCFEVEFQRAFPQK